MPSFSEFICPKCGFFWDTEFCQECGYEEEEAQENKGVIMSRKSFKKESETRIKNRRTFVRGEKGV
jgi:hypothetical protein